LNAGQSRTVLTVANSGDRQIQVGSHYHFAETNPALSFDPARQKSKRLDIAAEQRCGSSRADPRGDIGRPIAAAASLRISWRHQWSTWLMARITRKPMRHVRADTGSGAAGGHRPDHEVERD